MPRRYKLAVILGAVAVVTLSASFYIKSQVEAGLKQISQAEEHMNFGEKLFSITPESKEIGGALSGPIASKIAEGKEQVAFYTHLANWLEITGILCIAVAAVTLIKQKK